VSSSGEKGSFSTDIGQDVIDEALKSVERRARGDASAPEAAPASAPPEAPASAPAPAPASVSSAAAPPSAVPDDELATLKAELELSTARGREMMQKLKDEHERMLRAAADLDNFKKRAAKEKEEIQKFGVERLLKDLIPVYDNFDRALEHAREPSDFDSLKKGVEMIRRLFEDTLGKHGVKSFSSKGEPFDPTKHEAMKAEVTDAVPPNQVLAEVLKGFTLNERLVRPALVIVSRAKDVPSNQPSTTEPPVTTDGAGSGQKK
jgi:molecular chaperone GrpE